MRVKIEHIEWPDRPDVMMPYAPAIKVTGGSLLFFAGVTAAPVYHSHPHIPAEFDNIPSDMAAQSPDALWKISRNRWRQRAEQCTTSCTANAI